MDYRRTLDPSPQRSRLFPLFIKCLVELFKKCLPLKHFSNMNACFLSVKDLPPMLELDFGLCARVSQRFSFLLSPRTFFQLVSGFPFQNTWLPVVWARDPFFPTGQRFPIPKHVTSGCLSPRSLFSYWSAISHPKTRDFRFPWAHDPFLPLVSGFSSHFRSWRHCFALDQSEASICPMWAPFTTHFNCLWFACASGKHCNVFALSFGSFLTFM